MLVTTRFAIWVDIVIVAASILFGAWQGRPWTAPLTSREKLLRAVYVGVSVVIGGPALMTYFDLTKAQVYIGSTYTISVLLLVCLSVPLSLIAIAGSNFSLSVLDELRKRYLDKHS